MSIFDLFRTPRRPPSADAAKERLQIVLAYERSDRSTPDFLPLLQKEIMQVIEKYIKIDSKKIDIKLERGPDISTLEVNIELPGAKTLTEKVRTGEPVGALGAGAGSAG